MGNLYSKHEANPQRALAFYRKGLAISPEDPYLLTSLAGTLLKLGQAEEAQPLFAQAIQRHPQYPNAHLGLALLHSGRGQEDLAIAALERLFRQPPSPDPRHQPVYTEARQLYERLQERQAQTRHSALMEIVQGKVRELEAAHGIPIALVPDNSLDYVLAVAEAAWRHGRDRHVIRYRDAFPAITPHLIAHELEHLRLEAHARAAGRYRQFATTPHTRAQAIRSLAPHVQRLQRLGFPEDQIQTVTLGFVDGLARQLFNCPLDMLVEYNLYHNVAALPQPVPLPAQDPPRRCHRGHKPRYPQALPIPHLPRQRHPQPRLRPIHRLALLWGHHLRPALSPDGYPGHRSTALPRLADDDADVSPRG